MVYHLVLSGIEFLVAVYQRLQVEPPAGAAGARVRIMTMHGAKGLSAHVVFIMGLKENMLPGAKRAPFPGLVNEGARLLFVSITRARFAGVISFARRRTVNGESRGQVPSRYGGALGGGFGKRDAGLTAAEVSAIVASITDL